MAQNRDFFVQVAVRRAQAQDEARAAALARLAKDKTHSTSNCPDFVHSPKNSELGERMDEEEPEHNNKMTVKISPSTSPEITSNGSYGSAGRVSFSKRAAGSDHENTDDAHTDRSDAASPSPKNRPTSKSPKSERDESVNNSSSRPHDMTVQRYHAIQPLKSNNSSVAQTGSFHRLGGSSKVSTGIPQPPISNVLSPTRSEEAGPGAFPQVWCSNKNNT